VHALAATLGADIVRVHDVAAHIDAMRVVDAVMRPEGR
jgi:dihydropteroate synthase